MVGSYGNNSILSLTFFTFCHSRKAEGFDSPYRHVFLCKLIIYIIVFGASACDKWVRFKLL